MHAIPKQTLKRMVQGYVNGMLANESPKVKTSSKQGQDVEDLAQKIYKISMLKKPKVKYSMGPSGLQFYLIRTLPSRFIDKVLGKYFLLMK